LIHCFDLYWGRFQSCALLRDFHTPSSPSEDSSGIALPTSLFCTIVTFIVFLSSSFSICYRTTSIIGSDKECDDCDEVAGEIMFVFFCVAVNHEFSVKFGEAIGTGLSNHGSTSCGRDRDGEVW
jgi:hypothetical protein